MVPILIQNQSNIDAQIDWQIDAKLAIQKSIKNRALERQRVAKGTSSIRWREISELKVSPGTSENRTRKTIHKGSRHADGPKARRISVICQVLLTLIKYVFLHFCIYIQIYTCVYYIHMYMERYILACFTVESLMVASRVQFWKWSTSPVLPSVVVVCLRPSFIRPSMCCWDPFKLLIYSCGHPAPPNWIDTNGFEHPFWYLFNTWGQDINPPVENFIGSFGSMFFGLFWNCDVSSVISLE